MLKLMLKAALTLVAALLCTPPVQAQAQVQVQDLGLGKLLYQVHCNSCHYERIHKRVPAKSLVRSFPELRAEVGNRARLTERKFTPEELDDIAAYLDHSHYRFRQ